MSVTVAVTRDADFNLANPDTNHGSSLQCFIEVLYSGGEKSFDYRQIGLFDLSATGLTAAQVENARLVLTEDTFATNGVPFQAEVRRCTRTNWTEAGVTWNKYDGTNNWTVAGGDMTTVDATSFTVYSQAVGNVWYINDLAPLVKDAITNRSNLLSIEIFVYANNITSYAEWTAKEGGANKWYLEINYQTNIDTR